MYFCVPSRFNLHKRQEGLFILMLALAAAVAEWRNRLNVSSNAQSFQMFSMELRDG
jgi:hypothetical protein